MWQYVLRRVALMIPTFFGITLICFALMHLRGADPVSGDMGMASGSSVSQEAIEHLRATYNLDKPWYVQYGSLVASVVTLSGNSWTSSRPIAEIIGEALPVTLMLSTTSLALAYLIAIPLGVFSAVRRGTTGDRVTTVIVFMLYSLPSFWVGTLLLVFLASGQYVDCLYTELPGCFPLQGWRSFDGWEDLSAGERFWDVAFHLVLPVVTLTYNTFASTSRYMRSAMLETIRQDYVRTARAKGLSERVVVFKHALRNSLIPIISVFGLTLPFLISGSIIVEVIFGLNGMGFTAFEAVTQADYPLVITITALLSIFTMLGILLSDILYALVDPRIRYGKEGA